MSTHDRGTWTPLERAVLRDLALAFGLVHDRSSDTRDALKEKVGESKYSKLREFLRDFDFRESGEILPSPQTSKSSKLDKPYDDSFPDDVQKSVRVQTQRIPSGKPRKQPEYLEAPFQKECLVYAVSQGAYPQILNDDGNPDSQFWFHANSQAYFVGYSEFKGPTGWPEPHQKIRIKELRQLHGEVDIARVFYSFKYFKPWFDKRLAAVKARLVGGVSGN